ncbi:hypothetical protein TIFTF001_022194 [Ficus carica]|uniref:Uncharacterized protein n=1 Tax=Ficus carica TaxID=3494 RepID=A0AA88ALN9_FICCA|nr:hypothetical protein TIFTF001_022194 [Ficus carica]
MTDKSVARGDSEWGYSFELFYDDDGLRPLPTSMSECLLGSGMDRLVGLTTKGEQ